MGSESAIRARFVRPWFAIEIGRCRFLSAVSSALAGSLKPAWASAWTSGIAMPLWLTLGYDTRTAFAAPAGPCAGGGFDAHLV
jgi:hypothetical protein